MWQKLPRRGGGGGGGGGGGKGFAYWPTVYNNVNVVAIETIKFGFVLLLFFLCVCGLFFPFQSVIMT